MQVATPMTQAGLTWYFHVFAFSLLPLSIMHQICLFVVSLLKPKNPKSQTKSTTDENGQNLHHFVVPCTIFTFFRPN
jgi:hypothetical protein